MFKRLFCLLLALGLCLGAGAMAEEKSSYVMAGFDDTQYRDWASNLFFQRMEEKTGISFTFQQYDDLDKWTAAKAAMQAGEEMPDVLFKAALSSAEFSPFKAASSQPASPSSAFSPDKNSFASSPNSEQIFLICAALGTLLPDSHLKTVCLDTPSLSANCCCDSPFSSLKTISLSLKSIIISQTAFSQTTKQSLSQEL